MEVFLSELAKIKLKELTHHLLEDWSYKVKMNFLAKLDAKINQITTHPESCPKSIEFGGIYKCAVTRQTTFYYRINFKQKEIEIITLFDTRQDPSKLKKQLK